MRTLIGTSFMRTLIGTGFLFIVYFHFVAANWKPVDDLLAMAGKEFGVEEALVALHFAIVTANKMGQPKGQDIGGSLLSSNKSIVSMIQIYICDYRYMHILVFVRYI